MNKNGNPLSFSPLKLNRIMETFMCLKKVITQLRNVAASSLNKNCNVMVPNVRGQLLQFVSMPFGNSITIIYAAFDLLLVFDGVAAFILFVCGLCC